MSQGISAEDTPKPNFRTVLTKEPRSNPVQTSRPKTPTPTHGRRTDSLPNSPSSSTRPMTSDLIVRF